VMADAPPPAACAHGAADGETHPAVMVRPQLDSVDIRLQLEQAAGLVAQATARLGADDVRAVQLCAQAIALAPSSSEAFLVRSKAHLNIYRRDNAAIDWRDRAIRDAKRAAFMNPRSWRCFLQRSRVLCAASAFDEGFLDLATAEALAKTDLDGETEHETAFAIEDQRGRLQLEATKVMKANGAPEERYMWKLVDAVTTLDKALRLKPDAADTLNNRGVAYFEARNYELAMENFERALHHEPINDRALSNRALVHRMRKQLVAAHASLSAALALNPASAISHNNLGCIERDLGRRATALNLFSKAVEMDPLYLQAATNRNVMLSEFRQPVPIAPACDVPLPGAPSGPGR